MGEGGREGGREEGREGGRKGGSDKTREEGQAASTEMERQSVPEELLRGGREMEGGREGGREGR